MKKLFIGLFLCMFSLNGYSVGLREKIGIGGSAGLPIPIFGNKFNDKNDLQEGFGAHAKYHFTDKQGFELEYLRKNFDGQANLKFDNLNLKGLYRLFAEEDFSPVFSLGLGLTKIKNFSPNNVKLSGLTGIGVEQGFKKNFIIGAYLNYQYVSKILGDMPESAAHVLMPTVGITWYFGNVGAADIEKAKDLVVSSIVTGSKIIDQDNDGVPDDMDKCPETKSGERVNVFGCVEGEKIEFEITLQFENGKSYVKESDKVKIKELANFMEKYKETNIVIEGHSDNVGSLARNMKLSKERADAVAKSLEEFGILKERVKAVGYGPSKPIADNKTEIGRQKNRRVMGILNYTK